MSRPQNTGRWPNLLVIGAHKAGTTSLHEYLSVHPEIQMSDRKELSYFVPPSGTPQLVSRWQYGPQWYRAQFFGDEAIHGESSTAYANYPFSRGIPELIRESIPKVKLIYAIRDPVDRFISHYRHVRGMGRERRGLEEILKSPRVYDSAYMMRSRYWLQLSQYLQVFDRSQILLVPLENVRADRPGTLRAAFLFLGVDPDFTSPRWEEIHNPASRFPIMEALGRFIDEGTLYHLVNERRGARRVLRSIRRPQYPAPSVPEELWTPLRKIFSEEAGRLRDFTGDSLSTWSV